MANTLTPIIPDLYQGLDVVSRELVGLIPSVHRNSTEERAAVGQPIIYPITGEPTIEAITSSMTISTPADFALESGSMVIDKGGKVSFGWAGEQQRKIATSTGYMTVQADLFAQAVRKLTNQMESDVAVAGYRGASRAFGTSGTNPFATDFNAVADVRKILDDNGAPASERSIAMDTTAGTALRKMSQLTKVNESGSTMGLRDGELLNIHGFSLKESAGIAYHTKGTGAGYLVNGTLAVGATTITVDTGTGTILAGEVITFAGDTNKYVVAEALAGGSLKIAKPGLRVAPADNAAVTVANSYRGNLFFARNAIHLVSRPPAIPSGGDARVDEYMITDPRSGMTFEVSLWQGERMNKMEVAAVWGIGVVKPEHVGIMLG